MVLKAHGQQVVFDQLSVAVKEFRVNGFETCAITTQCLHCWKLRLDIPALAHLQEGAAQQYDKSNSIQNSEHLICATAFMLSEPIEACCSFIRTVRGAVFKTGGLLGPYRPASACVDRWTAFS